MEVRLTFEEESRLAELAASVGSTPGDLAKDAVLRLLDEDAGFRGAVLEGIAQLERGEFLEEEEMDARFEQLLRS